MVPAYEDLRGQSGGIGVCVRSGGAGARTKKAVGSLAGEVAGWGLEPGRP